jgi:sulfatase maturation enzyme AslB (radical SAM superfamily)
VSNETVRYVDTPVELEINGRRCQYAPMRMEWSFDPDGHPLEEETLEFEMRDEEAAVLQIHMTEACNLRCTYCSHFLNPKKGSGALTEDEIEMLLERVRALPEDGTLILHGGEPFLQAEATLRFAEASPCTAVIFTNGTLLTPQILDRLRPTNALLLLSTDGDPETTAQKRCGPRGADMTDEIYAGLELVSRSGVAWGIPMIMGDHNIDDIEGQLLYLKERYEPDSFGVQHQHYVAKGAMDDISAERIAETYGGLLELSRKHGVYVDQLARRITPMVSGKPLLKDCSACGTKLVYHPGGEWMNCTNNVEEDKSQHSWSRYLPVYTESCHGCIGIGVCGGGCIADAKALNPGGFDPRHCRSTRGLVRRVLEHCEPDANLQTTDRDALRDEYLHLVQGAAESRATRSVGHHAVDADRAATVQLPMAVVHVEGG